MERRLAAILATDVVGFSRLMAEDDEGVVPALRERRERLFEPSVRQHRGQIIKLMGDGALVEFPSIVTALRSAIDVQRLNERENEQHPASHPVRLRMGVNIGDVLVDKGDIFGMGVNVAARLQSLAEPGGICIAGAAVERARGQVDLGFRYRGLHTLYNIAERVAVFDVDPSDAATPHPGVLQAATLALPERASVAVLPFTAVGDLGPEDYLRNGLARDLVTDLSRFRSLFVASASSSFRFRVAKRDNAHIGRELGVRYLVDRNLRRRGKRFHLTVQLANAGTGVQVWAERFEWALDRRPGTARMRERVQAARPSH